MRPVNVKPEAHGAEEVKCLFVRKQPFNNHEKWKRSPPPLAANVLSPVKLSKY